MDFRDAVRASLAAASDELSMFAQLIFCTLPRSDQRRWAESYLRGLLLGQGRKSVRRIAEGVAAPHAVQSLQQFINQSPWDWGPVRARIAEHATTVFEPEAWWVHSIYIPKRGRESVGVTRRFVHATGRTMNCQFALGVFLAAADRSTAVNWRIALPSTWLAEESRRRAGIPDTEVPREEWEHIVDMVDEMADGWRLRPRPVVVDMRTIDGVPQLVEALTSRGLNYVMRVSPGLRVHELPRLAVPSLGDPGEPVRIGDLAMRGAEIRRREIVAWRPDRFGPVFRSQVASFQVQLPVPGERTPTRPARVPSRLVAVWAGTGAGYPDLVLTNLRREEVAEALTLARLPARRTDDLEAIIDLGLLDFEGRSYRGWHHHVTLVSAAMAFARGYRLPGRHPGVAGHGRPLTISS